MRKAALSFVLSLSLVLAGAPPASAYQPSPQLFDSDTATAVSRTGTGTLWSSCQLGGFQTLVFWMVSNSSADTVTVQSSPDSTFTNAIANSNGQQFSGQSLPVSSTASSGGTLWGWPKVGPCMRLQVTSGAGAISGYITLSAVPVNAWAGGYPNQTFSSDFTSFTSTGTSSQQVLPSVGTRQRLFIYNATTSGTPGAGWCAFGTAVPTGGGPGAIPLLNPGDKIELSLPGSVPKDAVNCADDASTVNHFKATIIAH